MKRKKCVHFDSQINLIIALLTLSHYLFVYLCLRGNVARLPYRIWRANRGRDSVSGVLCGQTNKEFCGPSTKESRPNECIRVCLCELAIRISEFLVAIVVPDKPQREK